MISEYWERIRPSSPESERTPVPESLETQLNNINVSDIELKSEIQKLENRMEKRQQNIQNHVNIINQLKIEDEVEKNELQGKIKDLQLQKARYDALEKRYKVSMKREFSDKRIN